MTLLELLAGQKKHKIIIAHFNHQLRGKEGDADEQFVREQAQRRDLQFQSARANVRATAKGKGISIEMAARQHRHQFLAQIAQANQADIILAHHADDQIETYLLRLRHIQDLRQAADATRESARAWLQAPTNFATIPEWLRREIIATQLDDAKIPITTARLRALLTKPGAFHSIALGQSIAIDTEGKL